MHALAIESRGSLIKTNARGAETSCHGAGSFTINPLAHILFNLFFSKGLCDIPFTALLS